jgi:hypothetical protein
MRGFFGVVLLRGKELSVFDRAILRGSGRPSANLLSIQFHGVNPLYNHHGTRGAENRANELLAVVRKSFVQNGF